MRYQFLLDQTSHSCDWKEYFAAAATYCFQKPAAINCFRFEKELTQHERIEAHPENHFSLILHHNLLFVHAADGFLPEGETRHR